MSNAKFDQEFYAEHFHVASDPKQAILQVMDLVRQVGGMESRRWLRPYHEEAIDQFISDANGRLEAGTITKDAHARAMAAIGIDNGLYTAPPHIMSKVSVVLFGANWWVIDVKSVMFDGESARVKLNPVGSLFKTGHAGLQWLKSYSLWYDNRCKKCELNPCICEVDLLPLILHLVVRFVMGYSFSTMLQLAFSFSDVLYWVFLTFFLTITSFSNIKNYCIRKFTDLVIWRHLRKLPNWVYMVVAGSAIAAGLYYMYYRATDKGKKLKQRFTKVVNQSRDKTETRVNSSVYIVITILSAVSAFVTSDSRCLEVMKNFVHWSRFSELLHGYFDSDSCSNKKCPKYDADSKETCHTCSLNVTIDQNLCTFEDLDILENTKKYVARFVNDSVDKNGNIVVCDWFKKLGKIYQECIALMLDLPLQKILDHSTAKHTLVVKIIKRDDGVYRKIIVKDQKIAFVAQQPQQQQQQQAEPEQQQQQQPSPVQSPGLVSHKHQELKHLNQQLKEFQDAAKAGREVVYDEVITVQQKIDALQSSGQHSTAGLGSGVVNVVNQCIGGCSKFKALYNLILEVASADINVDESLVSDKVSIDFSDMLAAKQHCIDIGILFNRGARHLFRKFIAHDQTLWALFSECKGQTVSRSLHHVSANTFIGMLGRVMKLDEDIATHIGNPDDEDRKEDAVPPVVEHISEPSIPSLSPTPSISATSSGTPSVIIEPLEAEVESPLTPPVAEDDEEEEPVLPGHPDNEVPMHKTEGVLDSIIASFNMSNCTWTRRFVAIFAIITCLTILYLKRRKTRVVDECAYDVDKCIVHNCPAHRVHSEARGIDRKMQKGGGVSRHTSQWRPSYSDDDDNQTSDIVKKRARDTNVVDIGANTFKSSSSNKKRAFIAYDMFSDKHWEDVINNAKGGCWMVKAKHDGSFEYRNPRSIEELKELRKAGFTPIVRRTEYEMEKDFYNKKGAFAVFDTDPKTHSGALTSFIRGEPLQPEEFYEIRQEIGKTIMPMDLLNAIKDKYQYNELSKRYVIPLPKELAGLNRDRVALARNPLKSNLMELVVKNENASHGYPHNLEEDSVVTLPVLPFTSVRNESLLAHHGIRTGEIPVDAIVSVESCCDDKEDVWCHIGCGIVGMHKVVTAAHNVRNRQVRVNKNGKTYNPTQIRFVDGVDMATLSFSAEDMRELFNDKLRFKSPKPGMRLVIVRMTKRGPITLFGTIHPDATRYPQLLETVIDDEGHTNNLTPATYESEEGDSGTGVFDQETGSLVGVHLKGGRKGGSKNYFLPFTQWMVGFFNNQKGPEESQSLIEASKNYYLMKTGSSSMRQ